MNSATSLLVQELVAIGDELQLALQVHRAVADTLGFFVDVTRPFRERVKTAVDELRKVESAEPNSPGWAGQRADALRRLAILLEYSEHDPDDRLNALVDRPEQRLEFLEEADQHYRQLGGRNLTDLFGVVVVSYEHGAMLRRNGDLVEAERRLDASASVLDEAGFRHGICLFAAERGLARILLGRPADELLQSARLHGAEFTRELTAVIETQAIAAVADGEFERAVALFEEALQLVLDAAYPGGAEIDRQLDELRLRLRRSRVLVELRDERTTALDDITHAVQLIGQVRGGWYAPTTTPIQNRRRGYGTEPTDPFWRPFSKVLERAVGLACAEPVVADLAILVLETMRRSALGGFLRYATSSSKLRPGVLSDSRDEIALREYQNIDVRGHTTGAQETVVTTGALSDADAMKAALEEQISLFFADAYLPESITSDEIRSAAAGAHALTYQVLNPTEERVRGAWYWLDPDGNANAGTFEFDRLEQTLRAIAQNEHGDPGPDLRKLANALLPPALIDQLRAQPGQIVTLYIAPDGPLFGVPWPALLIDGKYRSRSRVCLIDRADVVLTPALSFLRDQGTHIEGDVLVGLFPSGTLTRDMLELDHAAWAAAWAAQCHPAIEPGTFFDNLDERSWQLAYIASHGTGEGLDQHLIGPEEERLDFFELVDHQWPLDVVLASCWSGHPQLLIGTGDAPFGVSLAPLLRGARAVVGGAHPVHSEGTARLVGLLAPATRRQHLATGLCEAQRGWLARGTEQDRRPNRWAFLNALTIERVAPSTAVA